MLTGNDFIELLYLPIEDNKVKNMMSEFDIEKPVIDKEFKEDGYISAVSEINGIEIFFSDYQKINFTHNLKNDNKIFFSDIYFFSTSKITLPLNITKNMDYNQLCVLLGIPDYENLRIPTKVWIKQRTDESFYTISIIFNKDEIISQISLSVDARKHLEQSRYFKKIEI